MLPTLFTLPYKESPTSAAAARTPHGVPNKKPVQSRHQRNSPGESHAQANLFIDASKTHAPSDAASRTRSDTPSNGKGRRADAPALHAGATDAQHPRPPSILLFVCGSSVGVKQSPSARGKPPARSNRRLGLLPLRRRRLLRHHAVLKLRWQLQLQQRLQLHIGDARCERQRARQRKRARLHAVRAAVAAAPAGARCRRQRTGWHVATRRLLAWRPRNGRADADAVGRPGN
mmetsp:Transcript_8428/g.25507  ORF Transcript_8428/g.25507 Transcript_8428/m.25507 type:complete len:231 (-) Transcript_8428:563-1255(-)|eukprot:347464-Chlamydomonas_euryale.AAC.11